MDETILIGTYGRPFYHFEGARMRSDQAIDRSDKSD